jgi:GC-rich sequence DNA-binding factor
MYGKAQMESPTTPHSLFFYRQFWSALKLFRNILAWQVTDTQFCNL